MNRIIRDIKKRGLINWATLSLILIFFIIAPNSTILFNLFSAPTENWYHIREHLLQEYISNTFIIVGSTALLSALLGTTLAYFMTFFQIPARRWVDLLLVLPLAIPPYIGAYVYSGMLSYTGTVQLFFREVIGVELNQSFFNIMNLPGAVVIYTLFLYPYVYLIVKSFFSKQSATLIESARSLGKNQFQVATQLLVPLARGAIVGGTTLVVLEVLNDYGVVRYFGIPTFTTAIFRVWFSLGDVDTAVKLSALLMVCVLVFVVAEKALRGRRSFQYSSTKIRPVKRVELKGVKKLSLLAFIFSIIGVGFFIPLLQLFHWAFQSYSTSINRDLLAITYNTLEITLISSFIVVVSAVIIANTARLSDNFFSKILSKVSTIGYSIPGAVIGMGVLLFFISTERALAQLLPLPNNLLSGSVVLLIFAFFVRFLTIAYNSIESGFDKIGKSFFEASTSLGKGKVETLFKVDLPLIKPALVSAFILVFIDILKELPLTMILRPFNYDTLAVKAFEYANDEMVQESALASLIIIALAVTAIVTLIKFNAKQRKV